MTDNSATQPAPAPEAASRAEPNSATTRLLNSGPLPMLVMIFILVANLFSVPLAAVMVLAWAGLSHTPWGELGFVRPASWSRTLSLGIVFGITFKLLMKSTVMPLLGADPINHAFQYLTGNHAQIPWFLLTILGAGVGEEIVFRGYAFERLGKVFGQSVWAKAAFIAITSAWFGSAHYHVQGIAGAEQAAIVGAVFATLFARTGTIFLLMVAHTAFDLTAYALIYWNLETKVAHWVF